MAAPTSSRPKIGFVYLDHVLRFFDKSNFKGWPDKIETVTYHWGKDKQRFINAVKKKKIDVLIGNIPATAYETFRDISRELPHVRFIPSLDTQFSNKSKENVTHFCKKHQLPIPQTDIFYEKDDAINFLKQTDFPKIIKKSYGPSNYGGYFVHKVDSYEEAVTLLEKKKYYPVYIQQFVPMLADIRVMLIGHKPVCAFWRRAPEGEWLTNTSQGGSMDYSDVPQEALDVAIKASIAAKAEYWASDIALGVDGKLRILECATAFAAFPYIRDWIGQYLMWMLSNKQLKKPNIPMYNWEELGKVHSSLLRTMRHITFGQYSPSDISADCGDSYENMRPDQFPILPIELRDTEEWPSEQWNFQDNYIPLKKNNVLVDLHLENQDIGLEDSSLTTTEPTQRYEEAHVTQIIEPIKTEKNIQLTEAQFRQFLLSIKGVGKKMSDDIISTLGVQEAVDILIHYPEKLMQVKSIKDKKCRAIADSWLDYYNSL